MPFALRTTTTITRCKTCGTPLPAETDETNVTVTAGTLDEPLGAGIRTHLFCASRAD
ncbi:MAG TPA: GFA family protein [Rhizomicrobium sp.]|nr:GFA family protein [Rhizomicrobium sp.]